jgi:hypothetical protein
MSTLNKAALPSKRKIIMSCIQKEAFGADIQDRSQILHGQKHRILIPTDAPVIVLQQ